MPEATPAARRRALRKRSRDLARRDLASMIADLNEVRMRLDAVVRRLLATAPEGEREEHNLEDLRIAIAARTDRIREKLLARLPHRA
jgi:hypothetical protein